MGTKGGDELDYVDELDDVLQHFGVKGMRWGVRKSTSGGARKPGIVKRGKERIKDEIGSMKREKSWTKIEKRLNSLSDTELTAVGDRLRNENSLKRLSSRKEYLKRASVPDDVLKKRVARLQLEANFGKQVDMATKSQIDMGMAVIGVGRKIGMAKIQAGTSATLVSLIKKEASAQAKSKAIEIGTNAVEKRLEKAFGY